MSSRSVITDVTLGSEPSLYQWEGIDEERPTPLDETALEALRKKYVGGGGDDEALNVTDGGKEDDEKAVVVEEGVAAETICNLQSQLASKTKHCETVEKELSATQKKLNAAQKELAALNLALQTYQAGQAAAAALMQWKI